MSEVTDLFTRKPIGGSGPPPPSFTPPEGLSQDNYEFYIYDREGTLVCHEKRGHLVVTGANIVLFNPRQEMIWGIPNNDSLAWFELAEPDEVFSEVVEDNEVSEDVLSDETEIESS